MTGRSGEEKRQNKPTAVTQTVVRMQQNKPTAVTRTLVKMEPSVDRAVPTRVAYARGPLLETPPFAMGTAKAGDCPKSTPLTLDSQGECCATTTPQTPFKKG